MASSHGRVLGLDMLRSLAVLLVIASHFTNNMSIWYGLHPPPEIFFGGDLGVDLFFALSGFLIGRILFDIVARAPSLRNLAAFLARRWLRTLPVYFLWLAVLAVFFPPAAGLGGYLARFATMTQNLVQPMPADYWFAVSWSLTVEEWFYLLFGTATIMGAMFVRPSRAISVPLLLLLAIPLGLRLSVDGFADFATGYSKMVPFRLGEIGYGVVLAWLYRRQSWIFKRPLLPLLAGLGLIAAAWLALLPLPFRLFVAVRNDMAVVGCALCIPAALQVHSAARWLDFAARRISRLSYTLYLVHLTVLVDVAQSLWWRHVISAEVAVVISVVAPVVIAELAYVCVERPIMRRRPPQFARQPAVSEPLAAPS